MITSVCELKMQNVKSNFDLWMSLDPSEQSRNELQTLFDAQNWSQLDKLLNVRINFGTAGLRAKMGPGFSQMNSVTVLQASQGIASYLRNTVCLSNDTADNSRGSIVIGHDHRFNSEEFALIASQVFLLAGFRVYFIGEGVCATPMVPFSVDHYGALLGVMITASHNPKDDNGYKVYWSNGCQIIPPLDSEIQQSILANLEPSPGFSWDSNGSVANSQRFVYCKETIVPLYLNHLKSKLLLPSSAEHIGGFSAVYTAMHGVGTEFVAQLVNSIDPGIIKIVEEQCSPDPSFPTVKFPNPEEKGALELAIRYADSIDCPLVIANDPDADRFSFAHKAKDGVWKQFTGNEIGTLFADYTINRLVDTGDLSKIWLLNSTVSSQILKSMAQKDGFNYTDTLTGFKWIGNKAIDLESQGFVVPFAYEEAIGFMFPTVHDKDGISALLVFLQMYHWYIAEGVSPLERLEHIYRKYGYFKECNGYYKTTRTDQIFNENIRRSNGDVPSSIAGWNVKSWRDLTIGYDSTTEDHVPFLPTDASSQMITAVVDRDDVAVRFTLRGSGTEPKLKVYIEAQASTEEAADSAAKEVWDVLREEYKLQDDN